MMTMSDTLAFDPAHTEDTPQSPPCFGDFQKVCPVDEEGLMNPCVECLPCEVLRPCLQEALVRRGLLRYSTAAPVVARVSGFIKRWSQRKLTRENPSPSPE